MTVKSGDATPSHRKGDALYHALEPAAHLIKVALQMAVGCLILVVLFLHAINFDFPVWLPVEPNKPLRVVALGLEYAAGIELAYMLFTEEPDEAIQPLILGLAGATLLAISAGVSADYISLTTVLAVPIFSVTIAFLLWTQRAFLPPRTRARGDRLKTSDARSSQGDQKLKRNVAPSHEQQNAT